MIGQTISHYKILDKLGEGGMGVVYKAQDTTLDRHVALKFLPERVAHSEQDRARFMQEARAASALNHPNICTIYGVEEHEGRLFIAMELVDGHTLTEKKHSITSKQAMDIGIQVSEGLAAAHEKGVVHRDIKPDNIMIRKDGMAQIMDFGLAKLRGVSRLTKEGSTVGTAGYMSPEQVQGQDVDHRSDIFSLGVLLYVLFTGQQPFRGVHETALMYEIVNVDPPPMSSVKPDIDPALDAIVLECLDKDPNERTQSAKQVGIDLKRYKRESSRQHVSRIASRSFVNKETPGRVQTSSVRAWIWPVATALAVATALMLALILWTRNGETQGPSGHFTIEVPESAPIFGGGVGFGISPDGKYLAYEGAPPASELYLRPLDRYDVIRLAGTENGAYPAFSPDGQWIAFEADGSLKKISISGGAPQALCRILGQIRGIWWGLDNRIYFGHIQNGISVVPATGGEPQLLTTMDSASGEISHRLPQLLPDGKSLLFTIKQSAISTFDDALIAVQDLNSGTRTILIHGGSNARYVPTGHLVYVRGNSILLAAYDADRREVTASPVSILDGGWFNSGSGDAKIGFTSTGVLVYSPLGNVAFNTNVVNWLDRSGGIRSVMSEPRAYYSAVLSPDGQKIALNINAANDDIWVYHVVRQILTRVTFGGGNHASPVWSVDGKYVFYVAENGQSGSICRKKWDGSGEEETLARISGAFLTSVSPDGKNLIFVKSGDIGVLPLEDNRPPWSLIQSPAAEFGVLSPDGTYLAYESNESGAFEIYVTPFPDKGGKWQISSGGGRAPLWGRHGNRLFYRRGNTILMVALSNGPTFDFSAPEAYCEVPPSSILCDISMDDKQFLLINTPTDGISTRRIHVITDWFREIRNKYMTK